MSRCVVCFPRVCVNAALVLQYDESDVANESYICFRHREIKAVRKTRAQQATPSDKVIRLRHEMSSSIEIAMLLLRREELKREAPQQTQNVWNRRLPILELKRNFAALGSKEDDELLVDKERVSKKSKIETKYVYVSLAINRAKEYIPLELVSSCAIGMALRWPHPLLVSTQYGPKSDFPAFRAKSRRAYSSRRSGITSGRIKSMCVVHGTIVGV